MIEQKSTHKARTALLLALLALFAAAGAAAWLASQRGYLPTGQAAQTSTPAYQTTVTRRGDLALSISGTGAVVASQTVDLDFRVSGEVAELNVQPGDEVAEGQVLARLGSLAELELAVANQELAVRTARRALEDLRTGGPLALAQAKAASAAAEAAYAGAAADVHRPGDARCAPARTQEYYFAYLYAQQRVDEWEGYLADQDTGYSDSYILERLGPMRKGRNQAYYNYVFCQGYTDAEIQESQAAVELARVEMEQAQADYQTLQAVQGVDPRAVAVAQAELDAALLQLAKAQADLAGATLTAPISGTVMAVNGSAGDAVGAGVFITLAALDDPRVLVSVDETDLASFAAGCPAQVTFESLPGETFAGTVSRVSPALATVQEVGMVQGLVDLAGGERLAVGQTASVEITCQSANSVLYVPAQAVYRPAGQAAYVYVLDAQGRPERRVVTVGIETVASAEIKRGLAEGEPVVISLVEED
jgi:HlyD family secretion protein